MVYPLVWKIASIAVAKKAVVYALGRMYGYPRVYRRFLEFNRWRTKDKMRKKVLQDKVKYFFRSPNRLGAWLWGKSIP